MTDFLQGIENEVNVGGRVLLKAPEAIVNEIADEWKNNRGKLMTTVGISAAMGVGAELLLSRSPVLATTALTAMGIYQGAKWLGDTGEFMGKAWGASTARDREFLVNQGLTGVGKEGAFILEGAGGFAAGGLAGSVALGRSPALQAFAFKVTEKAEMPTRWLMPEKLSWIGPGTKTLPEGVIGTNGRGVNVLEIAEMTKKPWTGVEKASSIDLTTGKMSRPMPGTPTETTLGFRDQADRIWVHNHGPNETARPSVFDVAYTRNMGILHHENSTVFFEGLGDRALNPTFEAPIKLRSLTLDHDTNMAYLLESVYNAGKRSWEPSVPTYVNWTKAREMLSALDVKNPFAQFQTLPRLSTFEVPFNGQHLATGLGRTWESTL